MKRKSEQSNVKDLDPPEEERRNYLKTVGALVAGFAVGGAAAWLGKPAERVEVPGPTVTALGVTVTAPGATVTVPGPTVTAPGVVPDWSPTMEDERLALAQKYKNARPGDTFPIGYLTWGLAQGYLMMCWQANEQACEQLGLEFMGAVCDTDPKWIENTESMIAAGAKAIIMNCPSAPVVPELTDICNDNNVFMLSHFGYTGEMMPGDYGPRWVIDNTPLSDEQTFLPLMLLFEKMRKDGRTKLLHHQAHKTAATVSTVYINLGVFMAWRNYPEMQVLGHQYGEWWYEGGRKAAEASLAERTDYEGLWGANDSQTMGAKKAFEDAGIDIGPYTASRDMELECAGEILKGKFLVTAGFAIPYFGGRMTPMAYDLCVGAWYPLRDEMLQAGRIDCYGLPEEMEGLAEATRLVFHPNFKLGPTKDNHEQILMKQRLDPTKPREDFPYDFRRISLSKCKELDLVYDRHAGGGTYLGQHDYYYPVKLRKFGSVEALRAHVAALHKYFLDFSWANTWKEAEEYAKRFPPELKTQPIWV